jgi:uncharacterized protein YerC
MSVHFTPGSGLPSTPQQNTAELNQHALPAHPVPTIHAHQTNNAELGEWRPEPDGDTSDSDTEQQYLPSTPPNTRSFSVDSSREESTEVESSIEDGSDTDDGPFDNAALPAFSDVLQPLLDGSNKLGHFMRIGYQLEAPPEEQLEALALAIAKDKQTTYLGLQDMQCQGMVAAVAKGMTTNTAVRDLNLSFSGEAGSGAALATMLKTNRHLKDLDISGCADFSAEDFQNIFDALKDNSTLEHLTARQGTASNANAVGKELLTKLAGNQALKSISLPMPLEPDTIVALGEVLHVHPALTELDLGVIQVFLPTMPLLGDALKNGSRLTAIKLDVSYYILENITDPLREQCVAALFNALSKCPGLIAVTLTDLSDFDSLLDFLKANPRIRALSLKYESAEEDDEHENEVGLRLGLPTLLEFAQDSNQLTAFKFESDFCASNKLKNMVEKLEDQTYLNEKNHAKLPAAGAGMSVMLGVQRNEPDALPELTMELTQQMAEAVLDNLTPADAKAVFDVVAPYGEITTKKGNRA